MANPDKRTSCIRKLVSAARAVITYQVGLPHGCARLHMLARGLRPFEPLDLPVFAEYMDATDDLPKGSERLLWNREALRERDVRLEAINRELRDKIFDACYEIIERFGKSSEAPDETA